MISKVDESKNFVALIDKLKEVQITDDPKWKDLNLAEEKNDLLAVKKIRKDLIAKYHLRKSPIRHSILLNKPATCPSCTHFFGDGFRKIISGDLKLIIILNECDFHKVVEHKKSFSDEQLAMLRLIFIE